jgi:hypothetical protein
VSPFRPSARSRVRTSFHDRHPHETQLKLFFAFDETDFVERVFLGTRPMDQQPSELRANGASHRSSSRDECPCNRSICRWACSVEPSNAFCNRSSRQLRKVAGDVSLPWRNSNTGKSTTRNAIARAVEIGLLEKTERRYCGAVSLPNILSLGQLWHRVSPSESTYAAALSEREWPASDTVMRQ